MNHTIAWRRIALGVAFVLGFCGAFLAVASVAGADTDQGMIRSSVWQTEPEQQAVYPYAEYCETVPIAGGGWKTRLELEDGSQWWVYGWRAALDPVLDNPDPVIVNTIQRTGDAERPQDRRITWCQQSPAGYLKVQTYDGSNFRLYGVAIL